MDREPALQDRQAVEEALRTLPERFLGAREGTDERVELRVGDLGRVWQVHVLPDRVLVSPGSGRAQPDVVIGTDAATWLQIRAGELSGMEAFTQRRLYARGAIDVALAFEGLFALPDGREPLLRLRDVPLSGGRTISTLTTGEGTDVVLIHGLGSAKTSFLDTVAPLVRAGHRVHVIDLPGFGSSSAPITAPYTASWFADALLEWLDAMGIRSAHLVGNSMGGRIAIEVALRRPARVRSLVLLAPAVAFVRRTFLPLVRVLRPELALLPHAVHRQVIARQLTGLFADPGALDPAMADVAVEEFRRTYATAGARVALMRSARNIYLDRPFGRGGFYPRLARLSVPSLFVWGEDDELIPAGFARHVRKWLPDAEQVVLDGCGHVPQIERPVESVGLMLRVFDRAEATGTQAERRRFTTERWAG
jgi:pimeloyl-ACP methyl ester carboxylesterase